MLCVSTQSLAGSPLGTLPLTTAPENHQTPKTARSIRTCLPTFRMRAADQVHVTSTPDTTWPVNGFPPDSSQAKPKHPVLMSPLHNDASTVIPTSGTALRLPDPHLTPHRCLFHNRSPQSRHRSRSTWRFETIPRRTAPRGQNPSSLMQHHPQLHRHMQPPSVRGTQGYAKPSVRLKKNTPITARKDVSQVVIGRR